jgi:hypothetical protein
MANEITQKILNALDDYAALTNEDIAKVTGLPVNEVVKRVDDLSRSIDVEIHPTKDGEVMVTLPTPGPTTAVKTYD